MTIKCPRFPNLPSLRSISTATRHAAGALVAVTVALSGSHALAEDGDPSIDLRLFGQNVIEGYEGCHLAFWQANKSPEIDKYAYVLYAPFNDGEELPAWMKVGQTVYEMQREDTVSVNDRALEPLRLYRNSDSTYTALLEVTDQHTDGDNVIADKAKLTITQSKHYPFVISVKGGISCPATTSSSQSSNAAPTTSGEQPYGDPIPLGPAVPFETLEAIPAGVRSAVTTEAPECAMDQTAGQGNHYAISDAVTLWEVPCNLYARTGSSVYVVSMNENTDYSTLLTVPPLPGFEDADPNHEIRNPQMDTESGTVTSEYYDGDGTCGSFEAYQLRSVEGEALEFFLTEYREKPECDGVQADARAFPLVFKAQ
nr:hypothetical protein [uncultured Cohaesibacter sp.]